MKRNSLWLFCLFVALITQGCSGMNTLTNSSAPYKKVTTSSEMYQGPAIEEDAEFLAAVLLPVNFYWNLGDTARNVDYNLPNSTTWRFVILPTDATDMSEAEIFYSIKYNENRHPFQACFLNEEIKGFNVKSGFVLDHGGTRIMGANGKYRLVKDWRKIDPSKHKDIIMPISRMKTVEAWRDKDSDKALYVSLQKLISAYKYDVKVRVSLANKILNKKKKEKGIPLKSKLSLAQQELLLGDESLQEQLWLLLSDDWDIMINFPLLGLAEVGSYIVLSKVFHIGAGLFGEKLDRPGFMDGRNLSNLDVAAMLGQWQEEYGFTYEETQALRKIAQEYLKREKLYSGIN